MVSSGDSEPVNDNLSNDQMCTPPAQPESPQTDQPVDSAPPGDPPVDSAPPGDPPSFPPRKIELFEKRFENGYDVFMDSEYVDRLRLICFYLSHLMIKLTALVSFNFKFIS